MTRWIRTQDELAALVTEIKGTARLALDSESDSFHHYQEKVCLFQLATETTEPVLIDTLALDHLEALGPLMADPGVEKILHGADYDVATLGRDFGFRFVNLFDTMIAARFLGRAEVGLQAMLLNELGLKIAKDHQRTDWSVRPLHPDQERYAATDVAHLVPLRDRLQRELAAGGRETWVREECAAIAAMPFAVAEREPADFLKAKGSRDLDRVGLAALRDLFALREQWARALDRPLFKIVPDDCLLEIAARRPRNGAELSRIPRCSPSIRRGQEDVLAALRRAESTPADQLPRFPPRERSRSPMFDPELVDRLRSWRTAAAARVKLDPGIVLPQRLIERIAREHPKTQAALNQTEGLRGWRVSAFGAELLSVLTAPARQPQGDIRSDSSTRPVSNP